MCIISYYAFNFKLLYLYDQTILICENNIVMNYLQVRWETSILGGIYKMSKIVRRRY